MHRLGRRIDFSARQENIIRIIQSNESRADLIRAVFPIPRFLIVTSTDIVDFARSRLPFADT